MSELRQDLISGDWIILAADRAKRPEGLEKKKAKRVPAPRSTCPFEDLKKSGNWPPFLAYPTEKKWRVALIPNKYPALAHGKNCSVRFHREIYSTRSGIGEHDLVVTRDHNKNFAEVNEADAVEVFRIFQERARVALKDKCLIYAVPFMNYGAGAGASLWHPHYQILTLPIIPAHSAHSLAGAAQYYKEHHRCASCDIIRTERKYEHRIIAENRNAIAVAPYASKLPFEVRILPKKHISHFYKTEGPVLCDVVSLVRLVMKHMKADVNAPDINLFVHEAPLDGKPYPHHHWHVELFPRVSVPAGFEFSTGIYINTVDPDMAAATLRGEMKAERSRY